MKRSGGRWRRLASTKVELQACRWYTLRVVKVADRMTYYLDGKKTLEASDATFTDAGAVGLWTKADAVTSLDDLEVKPLDQGGSPGSSRPRTASLDRAAIVVPLAISRTHFVFFCNTSVSPAARPSLGS